MQFRDLHAQYEALKPEIDAGIQAVIESTGFILGKPVAELEEQLAAYVGRKHCVAVANGTDALQLSLMAYDVGPGDAVFTSDFTYFASAGCASIIGATPVLVDIDLNTFNMSAEDLERKIRAVLDEGKLTPKFVIPVDLFGLPADFTKLLPVAEKYGLRVLEDGAQGFGGAINGKRACSFGDISPPSFSPAKPLGCYGDGGAVFTDDDELAGILNSLKVHGKGPKGKYDNIRIGLNSRLDTIQAAVLLAKLNVLEQEITVRQEVAKRYDEAFRGKLQIPAVTPGGISAYAQYCVLAKDKRHRQQILDAMKTAAVPSLIYYPNVLHELEAFAPYEGESSLPNAKKYAECNFGMPFSPYLTEEDQQRVIDVVLRAAC